MEWTKSKYLIRQFDGFLLINLPNLDKFLMNHLLNLGKNYAEYLSANKPKIKKIFLFLSKFFTKFLVRRIQGQYFCSSSYRGRVNFKDNLELSLF